MTWINQLVWMGALALLGLACAEDRTDASGPEAKEAPLAFLTTDLFGDRKPSEADPLNPEWIARPPSHCAVGHQKIRGSLGLARIGAESKARTILASRSPQARHWSSDSANGATGSGLRVVEATLTHSRPMSVHMDRKDRVFYSLVCQSPEPVPAGTGAPSP